MKNPLPAREVGATVIVLQRADIEASGAITLGQLLQGQPGVTLRKNGGLGGNTDIMIRGDKGGHTLIMIDGVELSDTSGIEKNFDVGDLPLYDVERVEIVKGPHSVSYGGSGLSGIVHIITRRPEAGLHSLAGIDVGTYASYGVHAQTQGQEGKFGFGLAISGLESKGFSATESRDGGEADGFARRDASLRLQWGTRDNYRVDVLLKGAQSTANIDAGANNDDPNYTAKKRESTLQIQQKMRWNEISETQVSTALNQIRRKYQDDPNTLGEGNDQTWQRGDFVGERQTLELSHVLHVDQDNTLIFSAERLRDKAHSSSNGEYQGFAYAEEFPNHYADQSSVALEHQWSFFKRVFGSWGGRRLSNTEYGHKSVGQFSMNVQLVPDQTMLRVNVGRGYKTPSLYQRFSPQNGNQDLQPEYVRSEEIGLEQNWKFVQVGVTGFHNQTQNLIAFDSDDSQYYNVNRALIQGVEAFIAWDVNDFWKAKVQHTHIATLDKDSNKPISLRPDETWSADTSYQQGSITWTNMIRSQTRSRAGEYVEGTQGFRVIDSALFWKSGAYKFGGKLSNLENRFYREIAGYNTPGRSVNLSAEVTF
ncbi:MAG: TonB-dependent receptor [Proteobacteria bacterium]|nr:TonB-dependent receptor [Pseudomonadota bacterium]